MRVVQNEETIESTKDVLRVEDGQENGKVSCIKELPQPKTLTEVRAFLGATGYYRRFIDGYAKTAAPLTALLAVCPLQADCIANAAFRAWMIQNK